MATGTEIRDPYDRDLSDPGLTVFAYTAEPGSRHAEALQLLASWTAESLPAVGA